jgi:pimeloyl-ACP methyl ester carboxylesterase
LASQKRPQKKNSPTQAGKAIPEPGGQGRPRSRLRRLIPVVILVLLLLIFSGVIWQAIAVQNESNRNPAPGKLVEVETATKNHHKLHLYCVGQGSPTVVFEAGIPEWSIHWRIVQEEVGKFTRACAYDRAGYGWSEPGPEPRTSAQIAKELHELLLNAGEQGPYVLAVHSMLGPTTLLYAHKYPLEVAGLILVEAWSPQMLSPAPPLIKESQRMADSLGKLAPYGLLRVASRSGMLPLDTLLKMDLLPADLQPAFRKEVLSQKLWTTLANEYKAMEQNTDQFTGLNGLGDLPLVVVKAGNRSASDYPPAAAWDRIQEDLAKLSTRGRLEVAPESGHFVQLEAPASVVPAIREVVEEVKQ